MKQQTMRTLTTTNGLKTAHIKLNRNTFCPNTCDRQNTTKYTAF